MADIPPAFPLKKVVFMFASFFRGCLGTLIVLQLVPSAMAWNWYVVEEPCCDLEWNCCEVTSVMESNACGCETEPQVSDECGCGGEWVDAESNAPGDSPPPAASNQREGNATGTQSAPTPQPALEETDSLPPAPINVPTTPQAIEANELYPGPATAVPADTEPVPATPTNPTPTDVVPPTTPAAEPATTNDNAGSIFDEPTSTAPAAGEPAASAATEPAAGAAGSGNESAPAEATPVDDVFGEPAPAAGSPSDSSSVEEEPAESEGAEKPAANPLDDLFGPSSAIERPAHDHDAAAAPREVSGEFRHWLSRGESFECRGRLVRVTTDCVFIARQNGGLVAIAFSQLSDADLDFVRDQVQAQRAQLAGEEVNAQIAVRSVR
jgi:hypothetical protein